MPKKIWTAAQGLQVTTADQLVGPSHALILDNADLRGPGAVRKLSGYELLATEREDGGDIDIFQIAYRDTELMGFDGAEALAYREDTGQWRTVSEYRPARATIDPLAPRRGGQLEASAACSGNLCLAVWAEEIGTGTTRKLWYQVTDRESGGVVVPASTWTGTAGEPELPIVLAASTWWLVVWRHRFDDAVRWRVLDRATLAPTGPEGTLSNAGSGYNAVMEPDGSSAVVTMIDDGGTLVASHRVWASVASGAVNFAVTARDQAKAGASPVLATLPSGGYLLALVDTTEAVAVYGLEPDLAWIPASPVAATAVLSPTATLLGLVCQPEPGKPDAFALFVDVGPGAVAYDVATKRWTGNGEDLAVPLVPLDDLENCSQASRPFLFDGAVHAWLLAPAEISETACYYLQDVSGDFRAPVLARAYEGNRASVPSRGFPGFVDVEGATVSVALPYRTRIADPTPIEGRTGTFADSAMGLVAVEFLAEPSATCLVCATLVQATAGFLVGFDGGPAFEIDWHTLPEAELVEVPAGGSIAGGTYTYAIYWQWEDNDGNLYQSESYQEKITVGDGAAVAIIVYGDPHTRRGQWELDDGVVGVTIGVARSLVNDAAVFYEVSDPEKPIAPKPGGLVSVSDGAADAAILDNTPYSQAGAVPELPNGPTRASGFVACLQDRVWFGDPELRTNIAHSKPFAVGFGIGLTPDRAVSLGACEPATAAVEQDGTYYGFSASTIWYWTGAGPDAFDAGAAFSFPQKLPALLGVETALNVAATPMGVIYGSSQGLRLVARDRAARAPFDAIDELFEFQGQSVARIVYSPAREETQAFSPELAGPLGPVAQSPRTLRYAHGTGRWGTESHAQATSADIATNNTVAFLRDDGAPCRYRSDLYWRGENRGQLVVGTSWFSASLGQELEILAIMIFGRFLSSHRLQVKIGYDYDDVFVDGPSDGIDPERDGVRDPNTWGQVPGVWGDGPGWGLGSTDQQAYSPISRYQFKINGPFRACHAVRLLMWDETAGEPGESMAITSVVVEFTAGDQLRRLEERLTY